MLLEQHYARNIKILQFIMTIAIVGIVISIIILFPLLLFKNRIKCKSSNIDNFEDEIRKTMIPSQIQDIEADFVVIGGGTAGCVIASRLAEYGFETLLLSSGSNNTLNPMMREKSHFNKLFQTPHLKHYLPVDSSLNINNQKMDIYVWNTLGGNSINSGGMERMTINDWNYFINATNDQSFHNDHMSKYYQMVENFTSNLPYATLKNHGNNGPIKITQIRDERFSNIWKNVAQELNETFTDDFVSTVDYGFSFEGSSFTNGLRSWSCDAYLTPAISKYSNLKVLTGATAIKLDFNEITKQIKNVLFVSKDGLFRGIARKEYILSAGTFYNPHLLMLSGIGDPEILRENEIPIKHELKQVGKNLMDNGEIVMRYETKNFSLGQSIPVALINSQTQTNNTNPDTFVILKMDNETENLNVIIFDTLPKSPVGSISLYNSNPLIPPKINLDYLTDKRNIELFVNAIHYVRKIMSTDVIKGYTKMIEISPGIQEIDLITYVKNTLKPFQHFIGTCSIGQNAQNSVVDNQFKVHGIDNLRVVDASIFPANFVSKGPLLTIYALAEKAAFILHQTYS